MLKKMRKNGREVVTWGIVIFLCLAFTLWGVTDYFAGVGADKLAARVNGERIYWTSVDTVYRRMRDQLGGKTLDEHRAKEQLRLMLVQRAALLSNARALGFQVGDQQTAEALLKIPVFQKDGKFSKDRYLDVLSKAAYTDAGFRQELAQDILLGQLEQGVAQSSFSLSTELERLVALLEQKRDFGYVIIPAAQLRSGIQISANEIQGHYQTHQTQFVVPEQVSLEYVALSLEPLAKGVQVSETELNAYYQEHIQSYAAPERIRARHILVAANTGTAEDAKAEETARSILEKVKNGSDFSALAKEYSIDTGSAEKGGDLGWFTRGQMVPAFEEAAFGLTQPDMLAGPIRTQYGYHVIQLVARKSAETRSFEEVRTLVLEQCQRERAERLFSEKSEELAKLAFEKPDALEPIAEALGLKVQETEFLQKPLKEVVLNSESENGVETHPAVLTAAFSEAVLKKGLNSEPIQINDHTIVVVHLKKHQPATQQTIEQVEGKIRERLITMHAQQKMRALAETIQHKIKAGGNPQAVAASHQLIWEHKTAVGRKNTDIDRDILTTAFQTLYSEKTRLGNITALPSGDTLLLVVDRIIPGDSSMLNDNTIKDSYRQGVAEIMAQLEFSLYVSRVLKQAKVQLTELPSAF